MTITQMIPEDIYRSFIFRIENTNRLYEKLDDESEMELINTIFFKYYFDISTAIEAILRGVAFEESKKHKYIVYLAEPSSDRKSFFINYEELKHLVNIDTLFLCLDEKEFENDFFKKVSALSSRTISKRFVKDGTFKYEFEKIRKVRNTLAHGLTSTSSVDYSPEMLESFIYVLYLLNNYYKKLLEDTPCIESK